MAEEEKVESVKTPTPAKSEERELEDAMASMIELMSRIYRNQVIKALQQGTIDKFEDAQTGNYSVVLTNLAKRLQKKLMSRFSNKRIDELARQVLEKSDKRSKKIFYQHVSKSIGVDPQKLLKKDGMTYDFNALVLETSQWAKKLRDETLEMYTANTLRAMTLGESIESILQQYDGMVEKRKNHAKFTARNQIASFNSIMNKTRAQKLGVKRAIWVTSNDERVRGNPSGKYPNAKNNHYWANGREFNLDEGLKFPNGVYLLPGTDFSCRCGYRMILEDEE